MIRMLLWLFGAILAITFIRGVVGIVGKVIGDQIGGPKSPQPTASTRGALKKCAACGTYAPPVATVQKGGETKFFCSAECREKAS